MKWVRRYVFYKRLAKLEIPAHSGGIHLLLEEVTDTLQTSWVYSWLLSIMQVIIAIRVWMRLSFHDLKVLLQLKTHLI